MKIIDSDFILYNNVKIPAIGFGTWQIPNDTTCENAVSVALNSGYRHIDTAYVYGNEQSVGKAINNSEITRNKIFVTSKFSAEIKDYKQVWPYFEKTIKNLNLDYIDLYLIHAPRPWSDRKTDYTKENIEIWKIMEEIYQSGHCRAIGVSNFKIEDLMAIMDHAIFKPMVNQISFYIGNTQNEITQFCQENQILVEGYSPFATGKILDNETIAKMAAKYNCSLPQICMRYVLQKNVLPLPKSIHPEYIAKNTEIDFEISAEDMKYLDELKDTI